MLISICSSSLFCTSRQRQCPQDAEGGVTRQTTSCLAEFLSVCVRARVYWRVERGCNLITRLNFELGKIKNNREIIGN